jgi:hypothetical protein
MAYDLENDILFSTLKIALKKYVPAAAVPGTDI